MGCRPYRRICHITISCPRTWRSRVGRRPNGLSRGQGVMRPRRAGAPAGRGGCASYALRSELLGLSCDAKIIPQKSHCLSGFLDDSYISWPLRINTSRDSPTCTSQNVVQLRFGHKQVIKPWRLVGLIANAHPNLTPHPTLLAIGSVIGTVKRVRSLIRIQGLCDNASFASSHMIELTQAATLPVCNCSSDQNCCPS